MLFLCLTLTGSMGEAAISGVGDILYIHEHGRFAIPAAEPALWFPIAGLILVQGILIFALIRLREKSTEDGSLKQIDDPH